MIWWICTKNPSTKSMNRKRRRRRARSRRRPTRSQRLHSNLSTLVLSLNTLARTQPRIKTTSTLSNLLNILERQLRMFLVFKTPQSMLLLRRNSLSLRLHRSCLQNLSREPILKKSSKGHPLEAYQTRKVRVKRRRS